MTIASIFMAFFGEESATDTHSPITLAEAKAYLRVDSDDEDGLIGGLIDAAAGAIETETGLASKTKTVAFTFPSFAARMLLLRGPVQSVTSITYIDAAGDEQTLAADQYRLRTFAGITAINAANGVTWPVTDTCDGAVVVTASIGHASRADIDSTIKQAAKIMVAAWYKDRESGEMPIAASRLLSPLRLSNVA